MKKILLCISIITAFGFGANAQWTQIGADIDGEAIGDRSGTSVSLSDDGSILAIGGQKNAGAAPSAGHVRIYKDSSGVWVQVGADIDGEAMNDESGNSVSLNSDGSIVAIGALFNSGTGSYAGHVRVYQNISGTWTQIGADIDGEAALDYFGTSVSLNDDGSIVAVGADGNDGNGIFSGHTRIYENIAGTWTQIGADIDGEAAGDQSGFSVSLNGDGSIVAIGAQRNDGSGTDAGHTRIYQNIAGTWTQIGTDIDGEAASDRSGYAVSLNNDGTIVAIGALKNSGTGIEAGHVRIFENLAGTWTQVGTDIDGEAGGDNSGYAVSLNGNGSIVTIGAIKNDGNGSDAGHARTYQNISGTWTQVGADNDGEAAGDWFGGAVSSSSDGYTIAVGSDKNNGNGLGAGHVRAYNYPCIVNIPDANFKAYLVGNLAININADAEIQCSEASAYSGMISCNAMSISDLTGIEAFVALNALYCNSNLLTSLDLSQNTALTILRCESNLLSSINVSQNLLLGEFYCNSNQLTNLDISQNTALITFRCSNNLLSSFDFTNNSLLTWIACSNNLITSLDITQNPAVTAVSVQDNLLVDLDVSQNPNAIEIYCFNNQLASLNVANGNNVNIGPTSFSATGNPNLTCIQVDDAAWSTTNWMNIDVAASFSTNCAVGINELTIPTVNISPNPVKEWLTINTKERTEQISIYSINGSLIKVFKDNANTIDVSDLPKGLYILSIKTHSGIAHSRFIKE